MIRINLLPVRAAQRKEKLRSQLSILFLCLLLALIGCAAAYFKQESETKELNEEIAQVEARNNALKKQIGEVRDIEKRKAELAKKLDILQSLKEGKTGPVRLLDELSRALPDKLWLTSFSESSGNIQIAGYGISQNVVAEFMRNLGSSPYYANIELTVTEQTNLGGVKVHKFSLSCRAEKPNS